jgi:hypothetical protein
VVIDTFDLKNDLSRVADMSSKSKETSTYETQKIERSVRDLMAQECRSAKRDSLPVLSPPGSMPKALPVRRKIRHPRASDRWRMFRGRVKAKDPTGSGRGNLFRLSRMHGIVGLLAVVMFLFPLLIPTILLLTFWLVLIGYLSLGPDRVAEMVRDKWLKMAHRRPAMAVQLRQNAEEAAIRIDRCLDHLPANWRDKVNLPAFSDSLSKEVDDGIDPFDRLRPKSRQ